MVKKNSIILSIFAFFIVLISGLLVSGVLGFSGFEDVYRDALINRYSIQGESITSNIEYSLNLGKKLYLLDNQIEPILKKTLVEIPDISHLYVTDSENNIIYSTRAVLKQSVVPFKYYEGTVPSEDTPYYTYKFLDSWFACLPFYSTENGFSGTLYIEILQSTISEFTTGILFSSFKIGLMLFLLGFAGYVIFSVFFIKSKTAEAVLTVVILLGTLLPFSLNNYITFNKALTEIFNTNLSILSDSIGTSLSATGQAVRTFESVSHLNEYMKDRLEGNTQCSSISIIDSVNKIAYTTGDEEFQIDVLNPDFLITPLDFGITMGYQLVLQINRSLINEILRDMAVDSAVIIVVALIFAFILKDLFALVSSLRDLYVAPEKMNDEEKSTALKLIRISTFLFMFASFETVSFIPLYIQTIYNNSALPDFLSFIPTDMIISLPVGSYMFGIMISMFITLFVIKKFSVRYRYIIMSSIFIIGSLLTMYSDNLVVLILARFVAGMGFGGVLLSTSSLVIAYTSSETRSAGFGTNASGFAAASIASIPVGGVVVSKFGYEAGILVSIVFAGVFLVFSLFCVPNPQEDDEDEYGDVVEIKEEEAVSFSQFFAILRSAPILVYILCINIPFQLIYWGLFQFLLPLYMDETLKLSQSNIGLILSIFSFISLGAAIAGRLADKLKNDRFLISLGALCAGVSLLFFGLINEGLIIFVIVMVFMGVDNLFIDSIEEVYLESCPVRDISGENVLQSYKVIEKVLSVFVPTFTGMVISYLGFNISLAVIGGYSFVGALLFFLLGKNYRWRKNNEK